jgi:hypothetical protein
MTRDTGPRWRAERRLGLSEAAQEDVAPPRCEGKRHGAPGDSNDCMAVSSGGYAVSDFAGSLRPTVCKTQRNMQIKEVFRILQINFQIRSGRCLVKHTISERHGDMLL